MLDMIDHEGRDSCRFEKCGTDKDRMISSAHVRTLVIYMGRR